MLIFVAAVYGSDRRSWRCGISVGAYACCWISGMDCCAGYPSWESWGMIVMHVRFLQVEVGGYLCYAIHLCTCMLVLSASVLNANKLFQVLVKVFQGDPRLWQAYSHTLQVLSISLVSCSPFFHMLCDAQELKVSWVVESFVIKTFCFHLHAGHVTQLFLLLLSGVWNFLKRI